MGWPHVFVFSFFLPAIPVRVVHMGDDDDENVPAVPVRVVHMGDIVAAGPRVASHHRLITRSLSPPVFVLLLFVFTFVRPLIWYFESIPSALLGKVLVTIASQPFSFTINCHNYTSTIIIHN